MVTQKIKVRKAPVALPEELKKGESLLDFSQQAAKDANTITSWRLLTLSLLSVNALLMLIIIILQLVSAAKPVSPYITKGDGEVESLEYLAGSKRSDPLIMNFVRKSMIGIFTFRNTLPEEGNPPDPGVAVGSLKISTTSYRYTFNLSTTFAEAFRKGLAETIEKNHLIGGNKETLLIIRNMTNPKAVSSGVWDVEIVANIVTEEKGMASSSIPFNRRVTVAATPPLTLSEVTNMYKEPGLAQSVARTRAAGLEITNIVPLSAK